MNLKVQAYKTEMQYEQHIGGTSKKTLFFKLHHFSIQKV